MIYFLFHIVSYFKKETNFSKVKRKVILYVFFLNAFFYISMLIFVQTFTIFTVKVTAT